MTNTAITAHALTIIGVLLTAIHSSIDPALLSNFVQALVAVVMSISAIVAAYSHHAATTIPSVSPAA